MHWREGNGALVGDFRFDVAYGTYRLVCNTVDGVRVANRVRSVVPPQSLVEFLIEDDLPDLRFSPRVVTSEGEVRDEFILLTRVEGGYLDQRHVRAGQTSPRRILRGVDFEWWILADGYRPAHGDQRDISADGRNDIRLEPGFGAVFHAIDIATYSSLAGVTVFADGHAVGSTDGGGDLVLDLPSRPERLAVDPERWHIYSDGGRRSDIDPVTGSYAPQDGVMLAAYLRRVE